MIGGDAVGDEYRTDLVQRAMPGVSRQVRAGLHRFVHLGVDEGLVLAFVPSPAEEAANMARQFLFKVDAETVLDGRLQGMIADLRPRCLAREKVVDDLPVHTHVGMIYK